MVLRGSLQPLRIGQRRRKYRRIGGRYQLIPVRMALIKKTTNVVSNKCQDVEKREYLYTVGGNINW